jgi:hypothetical protein
MDDFLIPYCMVWLPFASVGRESYCSRTETSTLQGRHKSPSTLLTLPLALASLALLFIYLVIISLITDKLLKIFFTFFLRVGCYRDMILSAITHLFNTINNQLVRFYYTNRFSWRYLTFANDASNR